MKKTLKPSWKAYKRDLESWRMLSCSQANAFWETDSSKFPFKNVWYFFTWQWVPTSGYIFIKCKTHLILKVNPSAKTWLLSLKNGLSISPGMLFHGLLLGTGHLRVKLPSRAKGLPGAVFHPDLPVAFCLRRSDIQKFHQSLKDA